MTNEEMIKFAETINPKGKKGWMLVFNGDFANSFLEVQRVDELNILEDDTIACDEAEKAGVPFLCKFAQIVDTKENRELLDSLLNHH